MSCPRMTFEGGGCHFGGWWQRVRPGVWIGSATASKRSASSVATSWRFTGGEQGVSAPQATKNLAILCTFQAFLRAAGEKFCGRGHSILSIHANEKGV